MIKECKSIKFEIEFLLDSDFGTMLLSDAKVMVDDTIKNFLLSLKKESTQAIASDTINTVAIKMKSTDIGSMKTYTLDVNKNIIL